MRQLDAADRDRVARARPDRLAVRLGVVAALQTVPYLLIGPWGGLVADRLPKHKVLVVTQALHVIPPTALWLLTASGSAGRSG